MAIIVVTTEEVAGHRVIEVKGQVLERGRYRPGVTPSGDWQETEERFVNPTTGQLMTVRYNPQTGARDYVPVPPQEGGHPSP